ncbi:RluA family pseudouridine synthase [Kiritimatiellaeota bacterium B1221]|nr:RluA family pseudouridine synthase [Kiritimatiellaeota bacterium B1221]
MPSSSLNISTLTVPHPVPRIRLDRWLSEQFPDHSRTEIQNWIKSGEVQSAGVSLRSGTLVTPGMVLEVHIPASTSLSSPIAEDLPLEILYEDDDLIALNKQPGQVVHPAPGHPQGTVLNAMLFRYPEISEAGDPQRPGLVHRLDSGTSGVLLFARHEESLTKLQELFKQRKVNKTYHAICHGIPEPFEQTIDLPIGRHPTHRQKRAIHGTSPRNAVSHLRLLHGVAAGTGGLAEVRIETGRTHQIRVHLAHVGHPVIGDHTYAGKKAQFSGPWPKAGRVMLHAKCLELPHPRTGEHFRVEAPYADDMTSFLNQL